MFNSVISYTKPKLILTNYISFESLVSVVFIYGDIDSQNKLQKSRNLSI